MTLEDLRLRDYRPRSMLRAPTRLPEGPATPAIDAHSHLGRWLQPDWPPGEVRELVEFMDATGVRAIVNLDGMFGEELEANLARYDRAYPGRFATFAQWDRSRFAEGDWRGLAASVAGAFERGACGLKVWKDLGLHLRDERDRLVPPDDPRLDAVWDVCAAAGVPVTIHTADPIAFFEPLDARNERLEELLDRPDWWFGDRTRFPSFDDLLNSLEALIARRHDVTFIGAHVLNAAEDLAWVRRVLDTYPNAYADIAARISELGRRPRAARELLIRHPDRFLFGTDEFPPDADIYRIYYRVLESADESFDYSNEELPPQGRWTVGGLDLPADVLALVYRDNATRLIPGLGSPGS